MPNPTAAMLVIGDEILSGRTRDANMYHLANELTAAGIDLKEVRVVSDDRDAIVAAAFDAHIDVRDDARALLQAHYDQSGKELNAARLRMARIPDGAVLIDNPVSIAPGFSMQNVHVMAGVPKVFQAMVASLLPTLAGGAPLLSRTLRVDRGEGDIAGPLATFAESFADLSVGSYPFQQSTGQYGSNVVIRGQDAARLDEAMTQLAAIFA